MPRRRKIATVVEEDATDSDAEEVSKTRAQPKKAVAPRTKKANGVPGGRQKSAVSKRCLTMPSIREQPSQRSPMFEIFDKAQANESLHGKYVKELLHLCHTVRYQFECVLL